MNSIYFSLYYVLGPDKNDKVQIIDQRKHAKFLSIILSK